MLSHHVLASLRRIRRSGPSWPSYQRTVSSAATRRWAVVERTGLPRWGDEPSEPKIPLIKVVGEFKPSKAPFAETVDWSACILDNFQAEEDENEHFDTVCHFVLVQASAHNSVCPLLPSTCAQDSTNSCSRAKRDARSFAYASKARTEAWRHQRYQPWPERCGSIYGRTWRA